MNVEMVIVGILLFGGMTAGGVNLYVRRRRAGTASVDLRSELDMVPQEDKTTP